MDFALYFKPENTVSTFHMMKLVTLIFSLKKKKASRQSCLCPVPNPGFYFAIPGLKDFVCMRDKLVHLLD